MTAGADPATLSAGARLPLPVSRPRPAFRPGAGRR